MEYYALTDIGKKYDHNEDFFILPERNEKYSINNIDINKQGALFVLCDGIGGGNAGEIVSELTASWIMKGYYSQNAEVENTVEYMNKIITGTHEKIKSLSTEHEVYKGMGTTLLAVLVKDGKADILSVGDSRLYLFRNGKLIQETDDQSGVWDLYKKGTITKEEMMKHPHKHILNNAIGMKNELKINNYNLKLKENDILLLCSDGLSDMLTDTEIQKAIKIKSLKRTAEKLINAANKNGGKDNITVILIKT